MWWVLNRRFIGCSKSKHIKKEMQISLRKEIGWVFQSLRPIPFLCSNTIVNKQSGAILKFHGFWYHEYDVLNYGTVHSTLERNHHYFPPILSGSEVKASTWNAEDLGSIPESGRSPWRRKWQPTPVLLAWRIPWWEEPGRLQSIGLQRVGHDWVTSLHFFIHFIIW